MGRREDNRQKREAHVAKMQDQIKEWSTRLDDLVAGYLEAGAHDHDAYRMRIEALKGRRDTVQGRLNEFHDTPGNSDTWTSFRTSIAEDWTALETGFKDLTK